MFENKTFESIQSDMLAYAANKNPEVDTRDGSIINTTLAPVAFELENLFRGMDMVIEETFLPTASKEYLIKHGQQIGLEINEATYGHFEGKFNENIEIGSRFNLDKFNYSVIRKISEPTEIDPYFTYELVCETVGSEPNAYLGDLTPITFVGNLSYAKLTSVLIYGEDEEDTEAYRYRLLLHVKKPPINGNVSQYDEWLDTYDGIGNHKIIPCWNGLNTVKLLVLDPEGMPANNTLINDVQNYIDPPNNPINDDVTAVDYPQGRGMGNGQAPIGAIVTVDTATEVLVDISTEVILNDGYTEPVGVYEALNDYFKTNALKIDSVNYLTISGIIFSVPSVKQIEILTVTVGDDEMDFTHADGNTRLAVSLDANEVAVLHSCDVF